MRNATAGMLIVAARRADIKTAPAYLVKRGQRCSDLAAEGETHCTPPARLAAGPSSRVRRSLYG